MIEEKPLPWQELLEIFFRRKLIIGGCGLVGLVITTFIAVTTPPTYNARAKILLTEKAVSGPREEAMSDTQIKTELHHLQSPALIRSVLEFYQETHQPLRPDAPAFKQMTRSFKRKIQSFYGKIHETPQTTNLDVRVQELIPKIKSRSISGTNVIEIVQKGTDPEWTARFVNDLLDQHIKRIAKKNEENRAGNFYLEQTNLAYLGWKEAQEALTEFRAKYGANLLSGDEEHLRKVLSQLEADRVETGTRVFENQAKVKFLNEQLEVLPDKIAAESTVSESETVKLLKENLLNLELEKAKALSSFTQTSTRVRDIQDQIGQARDMLESTFDKQDEEVLTSVNPAFQTLNLDLVQTEARLVAAEARLEALESQIDTYRDKLNRLELLSTELKRLQNDVENKQKAHQNYQQKEEEARLSSSLDESGIVNLDIFERAEPPVAPESSNAKLLVSGGLILGLIFGVVLAFIRDFLDPTVKGSAQAFRQSLVPVVAEIPKR